MVRTYKALMQYFLLGTCGHVDHGKSALIKALTGFDGDTSIHERMRGITIDLSFTSLKTSKRTLGFIDVPGHKNLVSTMIGGSFGLDATLLVIDAFEGLKEQSFEHALVLSLLQIPCLIILSKADKCPDIKAQKQAIIEALKPYSLCILGVLACSIYNPESIQTLKDFLLQYPFSKRQTNQDLNHLFRLYIDRVFTVQGRGVAVSGTVLGGCIKQGDKITIAPLSKEVSVKTLHQHGEEVKQAHIHERVALHLQNIKATELQEGMLLTLKGYLRGFDSIDVELHTYDNPALKHNQHITLQIGTLKLQARVLILQYPYATLICSQKIFACYLDLIIISINQRVWGAALVLNPITDLLKKPIKLALLKALSCKDLAQSFNILTKAHKKGFGLLSSMQRFACTTHKALEIANTLPDVLVDSQECVLYAPSTLKNVIHTLLNIYKNNPQALLSAKSLNSKHNYISPYLATLAFKVLEQRGQLQEEKGLWFLKGLVLEKLQDKLQDKLYQLIAQAKFSPQAPYNLYDLLDIDRRVGDLALKTLCQQRKVIRLCHNVFVQKEALEEMVCLMRDLLNTHRSLDIHLLKENLSLSRKYCIAYLEYFDHLGYTHNQNGQRTLKS
ncbi:selenocysteine-specific translation elongation factor [Helicobacter suis]|uniref:selenocysteine-specific translation elongation factor n=1 Tax=Helicobacter suis TaxID=104628 RepID=UPI001F3FCA08|nr:selenocysteine-specific translation elongation factor [Helicobacter suis]